MPTAPFRMPTAQTKTSRAPKPKTFQNYLQKHYLFLLYPFSSRYSGCSFKYGS